MTKISIIFFSGYGHTEKQAHAVLGGVNEIEHTSVTIIAIDQEGNIKDDEWEDLNASDAIIFGSPTYMGGPAWQFKKFADASSKTWMEQLWKDKVVAGFTNSASINGDKSGTINYFFTLAMQHGMIWIGTGLLPSNKKDSKRDDINWLAGSAGALAQSPSDASVDESPTIGDLATARIFGNRIATYTKKIQK
ncbi:MAG: flavodoxin family protein [Rickettsiaceae bacterium]|nr:MAG: flavodoxin family protein [Rickettsiaceae bacterium]